MEGSTRLEEAICEEGEFRQQFCHPPAPFQNTDTSVTTSGKSSKTVQQTWGCRGVQGAAAETTATRNDWEDNLPFLH